MRRLEGKTAVITGCNRGIGRAILERFASEGANIIACMRTLKDEIIDELQETTGNHHVNIEFVKMDLSDEDSIKAGIRQIIYLKRPIDILVNNAGVADFSGLARTKLDSLRHVFQVNYFSAVQITQSLILPLMKAKGASVVNMVSVAGIDGTVGNTLYGASKASLILATKCWSKELATMNIRVNCIAPGFVATDMNSTISNTISEETVESLSIKRLCSPEEVAALAVFLASEDSSYITGQTIRVDGGM